MKLRGLNTIFCIIISRKLKRWLQSFLYINVTYVWTRMYTCIQVYLQLMKMTLDDGTAALDRERDRLEKLLTQRCPIFLGYHKNIFRTCESFPFLQKFSFLRKFKFSQTWDDLYELYFWNSFFAAKLKWWNWLGADEKSCDPFCFVQDE
jgi:hypothetical protein